jgi:hypothetical protein
MKEVPVMPTDAQFAGPYIDERVEHVGITRLRSLNVSSLRDNEKTLVIQDNDKPLAVLLPYEQFMAMQKQMNALMRTLGMVGNPGEMDAVIAGMDAHHAGKTKPFADVQKSAKAKKEKS